MYPYINEYMEDCFNACHFQMDLPQIGSVFYIRPGVSG
jgi:hypothetical protein